MAAVPEITISVPGDTRTLTMLNPEWCQLSAGGWQLGGWVDRRGADEFDALYRADRVMLDHPTEPQLLMSLHTHVDPSYSYRLPGHIYLKIRTRRAPRPHPAWPTIGQEASA